VNASRSERHEGDLFTEDPLFAEIYGMLEKDEVGPLRLRSAFGYQEYEKGHIRQTGVAELGWYLDQVHAVTVTGEHQHVRMGEGVDPRSNLGAYDQDLIKVELTVAPTWAFVGLLEMNNKFREQYNRDEKAGPFPAVQIAYSSPRGTTLSLWAGKRQAGQLCSGGVCKYEPAFEGVELTGIFRY